jgi:hypothetical protein
VGPRHWQNGQRYTTPGLALIAMVFFRATRSDAKSGVRKGNALPARRFESAPFAGTLAHQAFAAELSTHASHRDDAILRKHGVTDIAASIQDDGAALSPASVFNGLAAQVVFFKAFIVDLVGTHVFHAAANRLAKRGSSMN